MKKQPLKGNYEATPGEEKSLTIATSRMGDLSPIQIGFVAENGYFFFDTSGEQLHIWGEDLDELTDFIKEMIAAVVNKNNCPVS